MCESSWLKLHYSPIQKSCSYYIFVINFSNINPRIKILLFLDSGKAGLLENVQNHFSKYFESREISKTKVGTFFWNTL